MILGLICHLVAFVFTIVTTVCRKGHPFPSFLIGGLFVVAGTNKRFHLQDSICYFAFQVDDLLDCEHKQISGFSFTLPKMFSTFGTKQKPEIYLCSQTNGLFVQCRMH